MSYGSAIPSPAQDAVDRIDHAFGQLTAQLDIDTTPGHVGGDGNGAKGTCLGDDLGFFGVLAGIQHLVGDTGFQVGFQALSILSSAGRGCPAGG